MSFETIREEELKTRIAQNYFAEFDCAKIIGNIDFCVSAADTQTFLWAEAKKGSADIYKSMVQLILTIGKARTFDKALPPAFLGAFDAEKMGFIPYHEIQEVFYLNDFNWNITPSNHETKEFKLIFEKIRQNWEQDSLIFSYQKDDQELRAFIRSNFVVGKWGTSKIRIDKNNFLTIYTKWLATVKPTIAVNWAMVKKSGIIDADFYLADLLSSENESLKENLYVLLKKDIYELDRKWDESGLFISSKTTFLDKQKAHTQFWNKYERPPKEEYWDYIIERRDLLVPQDIRERKGSFFTPQIWVELSQVYLAEVLGENWQDEYYVWDCAAGTGNLLAGLTNKYRIWASTLDRQDVDVMKDRIQNGANLVEEHVFQFDFLNDPFEKLPKSLQEIIRDPEKRKKLVIYINPPYAEAANYGRNKEGVSATHVRNQFKSIISFAINELSAQFFARIYHELPDCKLAAFSKLKLVSSQNYSKFRQYFKAEYKKGFIVPANTFDNVKGSFPIGFLVWDLANKQEISEIQCNIMNPSLKIEGQKVFFSTKDGGTINDWLRLFYDEDEKKNILGYLRFVGPNFQANHSVFFTSQPKKTDLEESRIRIISAKNLIIMAVYLTVRHIFEATWLNDCDQFLYPNEGWKTDLEFQNDCLAFTLFHGQNRVSSTKGTNHWIPFTEAEIEAREAFSSNFMTDFIKGKLKPTGNGTLLETEKPRTTPLEFSAEAKAVFEAGKALWKYYHQKINEPNFWGMREKPNSNASLYDIREYFQGRNEKGKMNNKSEDEKYKELIKILREKLDILAQKIEPKVYEYGFLKA